MTAPSPLIVEALAAHSPTADRKPACSCSFDLPELLDWTPEHVAQALADAGVLDPEQVREREAEALHALADKWQRGAWAARRAGSA